MTNNLELISADGESFSVDKSVVQNWLTLMEMIELLKDDRNSSIPLHNVNARELKIIIDWSSAIIGKKIPLNEGTHTVTVHFMQEDSDYFADLPPDYIIDIINAANYLAINRLLDVTTQILANWLQGKDPEQVRRVFRLVNDLTEEEEARVREMYELVADEL